MADLPERLANLRRYAASGGNLIPAETEDIIRAYEQLLECAEPLEEEVTRLRAQLLDYWGEFGCAKGDNDLFRKRAFALVEQEMLDVGGKGVKVNLSTYRPDGVTLCFLAQPQFPHQLTPPGHGRTLLEATDVLRKVLELSAQAAQEGGK